MALATGQITIIDYNDALSLTGFIGANHPASQVYNPDTGAYSPNWDSVNLVLTASLYKIGVTTDIIAQAKTVEWFELVSGAETKITATANRVFSGAKSQTLTLRTNELASVNAKDYICKAVYTDPATGLDIPCKMAITMTRVVNGGGVAASIVTAPEGNVFKNGSVAALKANAALWRGGSIDSTLVSYQWYAMDSSVTADEGGGVGWRKLTASANYGCTGYTADTMVIPNSAVPVYRSFKAAIKDTDSASNTYNQVFWGTISFIDNSDPIQVTVTSSGGTVFKNGTGTTVLTAKLYQAGEENDSTGTKYTYKWYKYDKNGTLAANFGGSGVNFKTGKTLAVGTADVDVKSTFLIEVE